MRRRWRGGRRPREGLVSASERAATRARQKEGEDEAEEDEEGRAATRSSAEGRRPLARRGRRGREGEESERRAIERARGWPPRLEAPSKHRLAAGARLSRRHGS